MEVYNKLHILNRSGKKPRTDYDNVCRTCMSDKDLYPLFPQQDNYKNFVRALFLCTGLRIKMCDGLPQVICKKCAEIIQSAMKFRYDSKSIDKKLRTLLNKPKETNVYNRPYYAHNVSRVFSGPAESMQHKLGSNNHVIDFNSSYTMMTPDMMMTSDMTNAQDIMIPDISYEIQEEIVQGGDKMGNLSMDNTQKQMVANQPNQTTAGKSVEGEASTKRRIVCKKCNRSYKTIAGFKTHYLFAHRNCKLLCEYCGRSFQNNHMRLRHLRALHNYPRDNSFACKYCSFQALDTEQLESHERREHTKERPYICGECGEAFYTRRVLIQHSYRHKTETPFHCDLCPKQFKHRARLTVHKNKVHLKKRAKHIYGCYLCPKQFQSSDHFRRHLVSVHKVPKEQMQRPLKIPRMQDDQIAIVRDPSSAQDVRPVL